MAEVGGYVYADKRRKTLFERLVLTGLMHVRVYVCGKENKNQIKAKTIHGVEEKVLFVREREGYKKNRRELTLVSFLLRAAKKAYV